MNNTNFEQIAAEKTASICQAIKDGLKKNAHRDSRVNDGSKAINSAALSEACGVKNIGQVLDREAVSLRTVLRIIEGLKAIAHERGVDISETLTRIANIISQ